MTSELTNDLHKTFTVEATPARVFAAITNVRGWWSGQLEGNTDALGEEFSYAVADIHYSKFTITELEPDSRIAWLVTESYLSFIADKKEWDGTTVVFDITPEGDRTRVDFTHIGLTPAVECFAVCNDAWGGYITGSLRDLIETGVGAPNSIEGSETLAEMQERALAE